MRRVITNQQDIRVAKRTESQLRKETPYLQDFHPDSLKEPLYLIAEDILKYEQDYKDGYTVARRGLKFRYPGIATIADTTHMLSQEQRIILLCISQVTTDLYKKNTPIAGLTVAGSGAGVRRRYRFSISWQVPFTVRASQSISSTVQERALVQALKTFPKEASQRWERVAAAVPRKTVNQCKKICHDEGKFQKQENCSLNITIHNP
ncbi:hypothetical protein KIW84_010933 [Lathyrus oleraceus]|uniref:Uncharacterized protein n=1 Tax=Pisum sativum TaxID=3888 RepID=A0A9D4YQ22_PEA|nr:hypothetical protein KIW84_010933 [Pisum sativum]